jgi:hypothetical protein
MKISTNDLEKSFLDYAVAKALSMNVGFTKTMWSLDILVDGELFQPSRKWEHGGPIIEQHYIEIVPVRDHIWEAVWWDFEKKTVPIKESGQTPLEAAMRCLVKAKTGSEVSVPDWMM